MKRKKKNQKKRRAGAAVYSLLMLLIGGVCGGVIAVYSGPEGSTGAFFARLAAGMVLLCVALCLQTALHELGHLVAGLCSGYGFLSYRVGSLMWAWEDGSIRFRRQKLAGTAGQCLMNPPDGPAEDAPCLLYNFGGALANLVFAAAGLALYAVCPKGGFAALFFLLLGVTGLIMATANGLPLHTEMIANDGANALACAKCPAARRAFGLQMCVAARLTAGQRLCEMPDEWFEIPECSARQNHLVASEAVLCENRLMDEQRLAEADALAAQLLEEDAALLGLHRCLLRCDRIFCGLMGVEQGDDAESAALLTEDKALRQFVRQMKTSPGVLRTQYATALLFCGDKAEAKTLRAQFETLRQSYPYAGDAQSELALMDAADRRFAALDGSRAPLDS